MKKSWFGSLQRVWSKIMADQLRLPAGPLAKLTGNRMNKANKLLYQLIFDQLEVKDGEKILEIGFGNGQYFPELQAKANNLQLTGIDYSAAMVKEAIKKNKKSHEAGKMTFLVGNSNQLPFADQSFDQVFCINVIYFWEKPTEHLKEIHRVLKPGGYFYTGFRPKENLEQFSFVHFGFELYTAEAWKSVLEANGFQLVRSALHRESMVGLHASAIPFESLCIVSTRQLE